jgi:polyhydroxyalkanoate synthesis regulator phasin
LIGAHAPIALFPACGGAESPKDLDMAAKRTAPDTPNDATRKKRAAPTIDLTASEVETPSDAPPQPEPASAATDPPPEPAEPQSKPEPPRAAPVHSTFNATTLAAGLGGVALVALALLGLLLTGTLPMRNGDASALQARVAGLEKQLQDLQNRPAPAVDNKAIDALSARVGKIEQAVAKLPAGNQALDSKAIDALSVRVGKIEQTMAKLPAGDPAVAQHLAAADSAMKSLGATVAALNKRVDAIGGNVTRARTRADAVEKAVADLQTAMTSAQKTITELQASKKSVPPATAGAAPAEVEALEKRVAALEQAAQSAHQTVVENTAIDKAARLAVSAAVLRDAVVHGAPYAAELKAVQSLGAGDKALEPLAPFAANGVPSDKTLGQELAALIPAILKTSAAPQPPKDFLSRLQANADRLVHIRPVNAPPGNDPSAVLARIEVDAANADIPAALSELDKLPAKTRAPAAAWIEKVKARQAALAAARQLAADSARGLGQL